MKHLRQFLAAPFYALGFLVLAVSVIVDIFGCVVSIAGAYVEGTE